VQTTKVLHVDDDESVLRAAARFLGGKGLAVITTTSPFIAPVVAAERPDVVVMDVDMPLLPGDRIVTIMRTHDLTSTPVIFFSGKPESRLAMITASLPGSSYVTKGAGLGALLAKIAEVTSRR
jgi:DNA-binding response OmpR family regulator